MDEAFANRGRRLAEAKASGNTTKLWKLISSAVEEAFIGYLELGDKDAKNMRGRGTPHFIKATIDPAIPVEIPHEVGAAAMHRDASRHGTQASRLGHIAAVQWTLHVHTQVVSE